MAASLTLVLDPERKDIPLYQQVQLAIAEHIAAGRLAPGQQLPSERQLCERFDISRVTARRALAALVDDGLIEASPGKGWFVSDGHLSEPPNALQSFTTLARARGLEPTARVLCHEVRDATMDEAESLQVAPGSLGPRARTCPPARRGPGRGPPLPDPARPLPGAGRRRLQRGVDLRDPADEGPHRAGARGLHARGHLRRARDRAPARSRARTPPCSCRGRRPSTVSATRSRPPASCIAATATASARS